MALTQSSASRKGLSLAEKIALHDRQSSLKTKIEAFNQKSQIFLPHKNWDGVSLNLLGLDNLAEDINTLHVADAHESDLDQDEDELEVESDPASLCMPSFLGKQQCVEHGWMDVAYQELQLRVCQANDCLKELRLALGHKSLLFRQSVRIACGKKGKTRAWAEVTSIDNQIRKHVRVYHRARDALVQLGAEDHILKRYQLIKPEDLKMTGDIVEENRVGQRTDSLAWFWRLDGAGHHPDNNWMNECEYISMAHSKGPTY
jgi:hypothetical protein